MGNNNITSCTSANEDQKVDAGFKDQKNVPYQRSEQSNVEHESRIVDSADVNIQTNKTNHKGDSKQQSVKTNDTHMQSDIQFKTTEGTENKKRHPVNKSKSSSSKRRDNQNKHPESWKEIIRGRPKKDNSARSNFYDDQSSDETTLQQNDIKKDSTKKDETNEKMILSQENTNMNEQPQVSDIYQRLQKLENEVLSLKNQMKERSKNQSRMPEIVESNSEGIGCIQILQRGEGDFLDDIVEYLREVLCSSLNTDTFQPVLEICKRPSDVKERGPLLVVCISSTRVVEDAEKAIKDVKELDRTLLLIFHMKEMHVLPVTKSKLQLTEELFNNLGGVLDFAFTSELGVYSCKMNDLSKTKMISFIKKFPVECTRF